MCAPKLDPLFIAYYTPEYADHAARLRASLEKQHLRLRIDPVEIVGDWVTRAHYKSTFIHLVARENPGRPLVYLDADATVEAFPERFWTLDCDVAYHRRKKTRELLGGTLYFGGTPGAIVALEAWRDVYRERPKQWDQRNLDVALTRVKGSVRVSILPDSYTRIFDAADMREDGPDVIVHWQASRKLKAVVNGTHK